MGRPNFINNPKVRLLNPAKNELGKTTKSILDRINTSRRNRKTLAGPLNDSKTSEITET